MKCGFCDGKLPVLEASVDICVHCSERAWKVLRLAKSLPSEPWQRAIDALSEARPPLEEDRLAHLQSLILTFSQATQPDMKFVPMDAPDEPVFAHRLVLAQNSPFFKSMFKDLDSKEALNIIDIPMPDMSKAEVEAFVGFMYRGSLKVDALLEHAPALMLAADKFDVPHLLKICEGHLVVSTTYENAVDMLELAIRLSHSRNDLIEAAKRAILNNHKVIVFSQAFKDFARRNPSLGIEIFKSALGAVKEQRIPCYGCRRPCLDE